MRVAQNLGARLVEHEVLEVLEPVAMALHPGARLVGAVQAAALAKVVEGLLHLAQLAEARVVSPLLAKCESERMRA
jgi:hypothetical protein